MSAPPEITMHAYSGKYIMNKSLTDDIDAMLILQGLSWFTRKAISLATVVLTVDEYKKDGIWHIDIHSVASGLTSTQEDRTLDMKPRDHSDRIFGKLSGRSRMIKPGDYEMIIPEGTDEDSTFLQGKKLKDGKDSTFLEGDLVQSFVESIDGGKWRAEQIWGFEEVDGDRRHTRRVVCRKGDKVQRVRLVYDYKGQADKKEDNGLAYGEN